MARKNASKKSPARSPEPAQAKAQPATENGDDRADLGRLTLEFAASASRAYFDGAAKWNAELLAFFGERVRKDMEAARNLVLWPPGEEALKSQTEFVQDFIGDYVESASRMFELTSETLRQALPHTKH